MFTIFFEVYIFAFQQQAIELNKTSLAFQNTI